MTTLNEQGFYMPGEWHPHRRCWMSWPSNGAGYSGRFAQAQEAAGRVAAAIARFEPVIMLANKPDVAHAQALCGASVDVQAAPIDDGWFRDNGPSFVIDGQGRMIGVNWDFNGWGCKSGVPFARDRAVTRLVLEREGIRRVDAPLILEGGSFHVDGEGTLLTTEQCLLNPNRNPHLSRAEIEKYLKDYLGVEKVIWLKQGVVDDLTDGHIDLLAAFVEPGVVLALGCDDPADANYAAIQTNLDILRAARDAKGRAFDVIEVPQPPAAYNEVTGTRLGLSHLNFYLANGGVILPDFGEPKSDGAALGIFREVFKDMEIVAVPTRDLLYAGGNIHCITQQEPSSGQRV
jgi:agmatine deiminase